MFKLTRVAHIERENHKYYSFHLPVVSKMYMFTLSKVKKIII